MSEKYTWEKQAAERIKALSPAPVGASKAAQIRAILPALEDAMQRGVNQTDLVAALAETGLVMTLDELRNALYRERKRLKRSTRTTNEHSLPPVPKAPTKAPSLPAQPDAEKPAAGFDWQTIRKSKTNW